VERGQDPRKGNCNSGRKRGATKWDPRGMPGSDVRSRATERISKGERKRAEGPVPGIPAALFG